MQKYCLPFFYDFHNFILLAEVIQKINTVIPVDFFNVAQLPLSKDIVFKKVNLLEVKNIFNFIARRNIF
jgi:hypothetical protein